MGSQIVPLELQGNSVKLCDTWGMFGNLCEVSSCGKRDLTGKKKLWEKKNVGKKTVCDGLGKLVAKGMIIPCEVLGYLRTHWEKSAPYLFHGNTDHPT